MSEFIVLDASAYLAFILNENGFKIVEKVLNKSIISTVNYSEVLSYFSKHENLTLETIRHINDCFKQVIPFDEEQAEVSAKLIPKTKALGLSFGDRSCLSLGLVKKCEVLTADRIWKNLDIGVKINILR
jgi:PIN domain nuclease of toxin-antitoxin system